MVFSAGQIITASDLNDIGAGGGGGDRFVEQDNVPDFESTASAAYTDLATPGPEVTRSLDAGEQVEVTVEARLTCIASDGDEATAYMSFEISGEDTLAADDDNAAVLRVASDTTTDEVKVDGVYSRTTHYTPPSTGSYTFTAQYSNKTGAGTQSFGRRRITVKSA